MKALSTDTKVKVHLTEIGQKLWLKKQKDSCKSFFAIDSAGYTEMKFIDLLTMFEDFKYLGTINQPFTGQIIVIDWFHVKVHILLEYEPKHQQRRFIKNSSCWCFILELTTGIAEPRRENCALGNFLFLLFNSRF